MDVSLARARDARIQFWSTAATEGKNRTSSPEGRPELINEEYQEIANIRRAKVLEFEAQLLEGTERLIHSQYAIFSVCQAKLADMRSWLEVHCSSIHKLPSPLSIDVVGARLDVTGFPICNMLKVEVLV